MSEFVKVASVSEIGSGSAKKVEVNGKEIAIFNINGQFFAIDEMCPHRGGPLSEGSVEDKTVTCPFHGWQFDVTSGDCFTNPAANINKYSVKIEGNDVLVSA